MKMYLVRVAGSSRAMLILGAFSFGIAFTPRSADARPLVTWAVDASGQWHVASNWSSNPFPPGVLDDAEINRPAGDFEVTLSSGDQFVNSLSSLERLRFTGGTLNVTTSAIVENLVTLAGGTLSGGAWSGGGSLTATNTSSLSGLTLGVPLTVNTFVPVFVFNGLTLNESAGGMISLTSTNEANETALRFSGTQTLGGTGAVVFDGTASNNRVRPESAGQTLTIGPNVTIRTGVGRGTVSGGSGAVVLQGTLEATNAHTLSLGGAINFTSMSRVRTATAGVIALDGATLSGEVLPAAGGGSLTATNTSSLSGLTLGVPLTVNTFVPVFVVNGLTLNESAGGVISLASTNEANETALRFSGTQTLGGMGAVVFDGTASNNRVRPESTGQTLTIGPNVTIRTGVGRGTLSGGSGAVVLQGTLEATNAHILSLAGAINFTSMSRVRTATGGVIALDGATLSGGVLPAVEGGSLTATNTSTLSGLTLGVPLTVNTFVPVFVVNGLTLNESAGGVISLASTNEANETALRFSGTQTLGGTGAVVFDGTASNNRVRPESAGQTLTIGPNVTIRTGVGRGTVGGSGGNVLLRGAISTRSTGGFITIAGSQFTNNGVLDVQANMLNLQASLNQLANGTIAFSFKGRTVGFDFGRLTISQPTAIAGQLRVTLLDGFTPLWGDSFTIITGTGLSGGFTSFDLPALIDENWRWRTEIAPANVVLSVNHVADADRDGLIAFSDITAILTNYGSEVEGLPMDTNENGVVDFADITTVLTYWGESAPTP